MQTTISPRTKRELVPALRERYQKASRIEKTRILDEYVALAECHRKHAIRLLTTPDTVEPATATEPGHGRRVYAEAVRAALTVLWEAADRICGKRLKAVLPSLVGAMERHKHLALDPAVRTLVLAASPATIDRLLAPVRTTASRRKKRKLATKPSKQVPIRTFADWKDPEPGFLEIDFVSHGGTSLQGVFLWSLVATDVCSGWTEMVPLVAREQSLVVEGLGVLRRQFPIWFRRAKLDKRRADPRDRLGQRQRVHQRDPPGLLPRAEAGVHAVACVPEERPGLDRAEEWCGGAVVRRFVGYERLTGLVAGQCLARLYQSVRLYVNYFQPSFKLKSKTREGAKVKKQYHKPATPCDQFLAHVSASPATKDSLRGELARLDPVDLLHRIREGQSALAALVSGELGHGPERESLEAFLATLPELWRAGEVRPTHRSAPPSPRTWRTHKDPFEGAWAEILLWLQADPEATAKSLLERLQQADPDRYPDGQLRTLQRRICEWRRVMARTLVNACVEGANNPRPIVVGAKDKDGE